MAARPVLRSHTQGLRDTGTLSSLLSPAAQKALSGLGDTMWDHHSRPEQPAPEISLAACRNKGENVAATAHAPAGFIRITPFALQKLDFKDEPCQKSPMTRDYT